LKGDFQIESGERELSGMAVDLLRGMINLDVEARFTT
jgi:hypothetical protein